MNRLLREPLLHFLLLGGAIFALYMLGPGRGGGPRDEIVLSAGKIEHLQTLFAQTWQRPPTRAEFEGLVQDYLREEVAYRESMAAGLDRDDTIIRRRLRQKLEFVAEDFATRVEPSDAELAAYLAEHAEDFRFEPRLSFRQLYFDPTRHGDALEARAREILIALNRDDSVDAAAAGDPILLEHAYADVSIGEVANLFGAGFAEAVAGLPPDAWGGPIESGFGVHLVRLDARREGRIPELDEVRAAVRLEWENARRKEALESFYDELLARYEIRIEWPEAHAAAETP